MEKSQSMIWIETDQSGNITAEYLGQDGKFTPKVQNAKRTYNKPLDIIQNIINVFLPAGYPQSVTPDYLEYQIYDSLQAFSSSIAGLLSSRAVLQAVGFEDSSASPTAAILLNILQDSIGRIATILFAHRLGSSLEPECKRFRFAADIFNDSAMLLDCLSPIFPKTTRIMLLCTSGTLRALCGVAGGGSKAQLSVHFAKWGNVAELNAKDSSQETVISLLGMMVKSRPVHLLIAACGFLKDGASQAGSIVISYVHSKWTTWTTMLLLIAIHLWTNYRAVKAVTMTALNRQRANIVISTFLETGVVLTPSAVAKKERIFERDGVFRWCNGEILGYGLIGQRLSGFVDPTLCYNGRNNIFDVAQVLHDEPYLLWKQDTNTFCINLEKQSTAADQLKAWMHGIMLAKAAPHEARWRTLESLATTKAMIDKTFDEFLQSLGSAGWNVERSQLETSPGFRYSSKEHL